MIFVFYEELKVSLEKLDGLVTLVPNSHPANYTTDTDTHPICDISETIVNLFFGCIDTFRKRRTQSVTET